MGKRQKKWQDRLNDALEDAFIEAHNIHDCPESVVASVKFADGSYIEVELYKNNNIEVYYYHADKSNQMDCPNITKYLEDNLADWDVLKEMYDNYPTDEWQANGFRDEADYWRYRMGR